MKVISGEDARVGPMPTIAPLLVYLPMNRGIYLYNCLNPDLSGEVPVGDFFIFRSWYCCPVTAWYSRARNMCCSTNYEK